MYNNRWDDENPNPNRYRQTSDSVVSVGTWIAISLIIGVIGIIPYVGPFIDLIILICMSFMDINQNIKNWARAGLILFVIALFLVLLITGSLLLTM